MRLILKFCYIILGLYYFNRLLRFSFIILTIQENSKHEDFCLFSKIALNHEHEDFLSVHIFWEHEDSTVSSFYKHEYKDF